MGGIEDALNFVVEKLKEIWLAIENFWGQFLGWFDKVFPPETRPEKIHQWLHVALPILIVLVAVMVGTCMIYYCCKCFCKFCCGRGRRRGYNRTMKAPGRNCRMRRSDFESNPKSYFERLRAYPGDELC